MSEWVEPDKPLTIETRRGGRKKTSMKHNRYGDDFLVDKILPDEKGADLVSMGDLVQDKKWQIIEDDTDFWQEDQNRPEREGSRTERNKNEGAHELEDSRVHV